MSTANVETQGTLRDHIELLHQHEYYVWSEGRADGRYQFEIAVCPEAEGGYSVVVPELAGVVTEGDTVDEAIAHAAEAIQGALLVYKEDGGSIPIRRDGQPNLPADCIRKWIVVNA